MSYTPDPQLPPREQAYLEAFVEESNKIEGIVRPALGSEILATLVFIELPQITVDDVEKFVSELQPNAVLRKFVTIANVKVGSARHGYYKAPKSGPEILRGLKDILKTVNAGGSDPFETHRAYETLHPFTDGNGRSGRAIWLWQMRRERSGSDVDRGYLHSRSPLNFLHSYYYQSLVAGREKDEL